MKKLCKYILIIVAVVLLSGCNNGNNIKKITYSEFNKMIEDKETFIIEVSQDGCSHCIEYQPIFTKTIKDNNITAYNLNITKMSSKEYDKFDDTYNFEGTPTTMFFKKGKEVLSSRITGSTTEKKLTKVLKRLGYIK